ncbi:MAG: MFS transporter [Cyanobacteria bacterium P01_D01_bin.50]
MSNIVKQPCDAGVINTKRCSICCSYITERWVLVVTILGSSMVMIDGTAVNIALPVLQQAFDATAAQVQWVVESYALFLAALILVGASLGDRFGRRLIYAYGITLFALASGWCGLSPNINQLIVARAFQGIGAALFIPGSLAMIGAYFELRQRRKAIIIWSYFTAITSAIGIFLGAWLIENLSWRWIFLINLPFSIVILLILFRSVPETYEREFIRIDYWGTILATLSLGAFVFGLIESSHFGIFHPLVIACVAFGILFLGAFIFLEANIYGPIIPLSLFKSRIFSGVNLLTLLLYSAFGGAFYFIPFNLIQIQGYSPTIAGAAFLPFILVILFMSNYSDNFVTHYGIKLPLMVGSLIVAIGFMLFTIPGIDGSYWITFFPATIVLSLGISISLAPLTKTVIGGVRQRQAGTALQINNAISRLAELLAIAFFNIFVFNAFNYSLDRRLAGLKLPSQVQQVLAEQRINLAAAKIPDNISEPLKNELEKAIALSYVESFRLIMFIAAVLAVASIIVTLFTIEKLQKPRL